MLQKMKPVLLPLLLGSVLVCLSGCGGETALSPKSTLTAEFLKVGKADAIILTCGSEVMVLDAGEADDGAELVRELTEIGAERIDYLIITHFDKDHVGGAAALLGAFDVGTVILPDYEGTTQDYALFTAALENENISPLRLDENYSFSFGDAFVTVEPPSSYEITDETAEYDNNFSLITTIVHGENRLLFMGDAEKAAIKDWLSRGNAAGCTLLKVPHHGVYNKALPDLIQAVSPEYAVICDSSKNPADTETLDLLTPVSSVYETKDGNVTVVSDGRTLTVSQ